MLIDVNDSASIKEFLKCCSAEAGIYQMQSGKGEVLYVGKAKNLAKRLYSYFKANQSPKTASLVKQIHSIVTTVTNTESEALILECNLIKQHKPKYNILLRDDKSYPYICLSKHRYPRLFLYRGKKLADAVCFGPYPNVYAAKQTIRLLQQVFKLRTCTDNHFKNRVRPCLLYQINRCTAPCVKKINEKDYTESFKSTKLFLDGKSQELIRDFANKMEIASFSQDYENAAYLRDQIQKLQQVFEQQYVEVQNKSNKKATDVIALCLSDLYLVIAVLKFREGRLVGSNKYINKIPLDFKNIESELEQEVLLSVFSQYYLNFSDNNPEEIIINYKISSDSKKLLSSIIEFDNLKILSNPRGVKLNWLNLAIKNAEELLVEKAKYKDIYLNQFKILHQELGLQALPQTIECIDVSHTFGSQTIASCVVFKQSGPDKSGYRKYNINNITKGDDIAAIKQTLIRRYKKILDNNEKNKLPDLILIDGGKPQVNIAKQVLAQLNLESIPLYGITKGEGRKAVNDRILSGLNFKDVLMSEKSIAKHLLQQIRDEAHRFAIVGHRAKRGKEQLHSSLEDIPGIGAKRRKNLLTYLGGMQQIKKASKQQLAKVPGISQRQAELIYDYLHK